MKKHTSTTVFDNFNVTCKFDINVHKRISTGLPECENDNWKVFLRPHRFGYPCNTLVDKRVEGSLRMLDYYYWGYEKFLAYLTKFGDSISKVHMSGLGIGMMIPVILSYGNIEKLNVVEISDSLIDLIGPFYDPYISDGRLEIHCFDAREWDPNENHYDVAFHDIWSAVKKEESINILKRYMSFCDKQFCWSGSWK